MAGGGRVVALHSLCVREVRDGVHGSRDVGWGNGGETKRVRVREIGVRGLSATVPAAMDHRVIQKTAFVLSLMKLV